MFCLSAMSVSCLICVILVEADKQLTNINRNRETCYLERKSTQLSVTTFSYRSLLIFLVSHGSVSGFSSLQSFSTEKQNYNIGIYNRPKISVWRKIREPIKSISQRQTDRQREREERVNKASLMLIIGTLKEILLLFRFGTVSTRKFVYKEIWGLGTLLLKTIF
jgi:hypothetical protein